MDGWCAFLLLILPGVWIVEAQQNHAPKFDPCCDMSDLILPETTKIFTNVYNVSATDSDHGVVDSHVIRYYVDGDIFSIPDAASGRVYLIKPLDYEGTRQIIVTVTASDGKTETRNTVTVQVSDINDELPTFGHTTYQKVLDEDAPLGTVIAELSVKDADIVNDQLQVRCRADARHIQIYGKVCDIFRVLTTKVNNVEWAGKLVLNRFLDYEDKQSYQVPLVASDGKNEQNQSVEVTVRDVQDTPPYFISAPAATIDENVPLTYFVTQAQAVDGDRSLQRTIVYQLYINPEDSFRIGSSSGIIRPNKNIDREDTLFAKGYIDVTVVARELISPGILGNDSLTTAQTTIRINVNDINDNKPEFNQPSYDGSIPEDIPTGSPVPNLILTITDRDQSLSSLYDITLLNYTREFEVFPNEGRATTVAGIRVRDTRLIDYDYRAQEYQLMIKVQERNTAERFMNYAMVIIKVTDVNDIVPTFTPLTYQATVLETSGEGTRVVRVNATDVDSKDWGTAGIVYELLGNGAHLFHINQDQVSGFVSVAKCATPGSGNCIDFERTKQYTLSVAATDDKGKGQTKTTTIIIDVLDQNDNPPKPYQKTYYGTIREHEIEFIGTPVNITAEDADANSQIEYFIISQTGPANRFLINKYTGVVVGNRNNPILFLDTPGAKGIIILEVGITDGVHTTEVKVEITVIDVNDEAPIFHNSPYDANINETTRGGYFVEQVMAVDGDSPTTNAGTFRYSIESGSQNKFVIDALDGKITTHSSATFDFNAQNLYQMEVHAVDRGNPPKTGTARVNVHITDENNRLPIFPRNTERAEVYENVGVGTQVTILTATDSDALSHLQYSMVASSAKKPNGQPITPQDSHLYRDLFSVDGSTGRVSVNQDLDRDIVAVVTYGLRAVDTNALPRQTGTATLVITILDINDKPPIFLPPWTVISPYYHVTIDEEMPIGRFVGMFPARDPDGSIRGYELLNNIGGFFSVQATGRVQMNSRIDYDADRRDYLRFTVRAYDSGNPKLSADAHINVTVLNINDNRPHFNKHSYSFLIPEDKAPNSPIGSVSATDLDLSPCDSFSFALDGATGVFDIDPRSGDISVSSSARLDLETTENYNFEVIVTDVPCKPNGTVHENSVPVNIQLSDVNDNPPKFSKPLYAVTVPETLPVSASVVIVSANDADISDANALVFLKVHGSGDPNDLFSVAPSGLVMSQRSLRGHGGVHRFDVEVRDNNGVRPYFTSQASVMVTVLQVSNHFPEWIRPKEEETVDVLEEQYLGMLIYDCHAIDKDGGENGRITYGFHVNGQNTVVTKEFRINPITGVIRAERVFDREETDYYSLLLVATDGGQRPKETTRFLSIRIKDVNDHLPAFRAPRVKACTILEDQKVGEIDCTVTATDIDIDDTVTYVIRARNDDPHIFSINPTNGRMSLSRPLRITQRSTFAFEIEAKNDRTDYTVVRSRSKRAEAENIMSITLEVYDQNNNAPTFITENPNICVSSEVNLQASLYKMIATDVDKNDRLIYDISSVSRLPVFLGNNANIFSISLDQGVIKNELLLGSHTGTVFQLSVVVSDEVDNVDTRHNVTTKPMVYISDETEAVALVVKQPRESVVEIAPSFQKIVAKSLQKSDGDELVVCISKVKSHVTPAGTVNDQWSDLYVNAFRVNKLDNNPVLMKNSELSTELDSALTDDERKKDLVSLNVDGVKGEAEQTTVAWTRPLLVVLIIVCLLILLALILVCVCCYQYCCSKPQACFEERGRRTVETEEEEMARIMSGEYVDDDTNLQPVVVKRPSEFGEYHTTGEYQGQYDNAALHEFGQGKRSAVEGKEI